MEKKYVYDFLKKHLENNTYEEKLYVEKDIENGYIIAIKVPHQSGVRKKNKENMYQVFIDYALLKGNSKPETNEQYTNCIQNFLNALKHCRTFSVGKVTKIKNITSYGVIEKQSYKYFIFPCEEKEKPLWPVRLPFKVEKSLSDSMATDQAVPEPNFSVEKIESHPNNLEFEKISKPMAKENEFVTNANNPMWIITLVSSDNAEQESPFSEIKTEINLNVSYILGYVKEKINHAVQDPHFFNNYSNETLNDIEELVNKYLLTDEDLKIDPNLCINDEVKKILAIVKDFSNEENELDRNCKITAPIATDLPVLEFPVSEQMLEIDPKIEHVLIK